MEKKITIADNFNALLALNEVQAHPELVEFINDRLAKLEAKKNAPRKPSKASTENEKLATALVEEMDADRIYSLAEVAEILTSMAGGDAKVSTSKATAVLTKARNMGLMKRDEVKGKANYSLA